MQVLGIDTGDAKSICYLADKNGRLLGKDRSGGANLKAEGELGVEKVLHTVMDQAIGKTPARGGRDLPGHGGCGP